MRSKIVGRDGRRGGGRDRAQVRPVDGSDRGPVDRAVDVPFAAVVLRQNTITPSVENQNVRDRVLPDVSGRQTRRPGCRFQASDAAVVRNVGRNVGDRRVHTVSGPGHDYLRQVHAFVRDAIIRFDRIIRRSYVCLSARFVFVLIGVKKKINYET